MPVDELYLRQAALLVRTIPLVAAETCFALKGGTAINLFVRNMPRLSVDIDLTYLPVADRAASLKEIDAAMRRMADAISRGIRGAHVVLSKPKGEDCVTKLIVQADDVQIKIEVTPVLRGCVYEPVVKSVSARVEDEFGFAEIQVVSFADLYAGKIVAALDRQHPRDLFDVRDLLANEGINDDLRKAFIVYVLMHRVNVDSMERFQGARCRVAIISDAGSIGISLHSSNRAPNRERRVHITLELGWSADKQMQCFGRTHRSDQAIPPEYVLLSTELGGEKRFSSTIARRLASLGALTKGDRGAADNADWQRYNFETEEGKSALCLMYKRIVAGESVQGLANPKQTLRDIGLLVIREGAEEIRKEDQYNVPRFLNRILALDVEEQNALFDYFADLFDQTVRYARASGTFDEGVTDIRALAIKVAKPPVVVHIDRVTGAETVLYTLEVDRPSDTVSFERAERLRVNNKGAFLRHHKKGGFVLALPSGQHTDPRDGKTFLTYSLWKPEAARTSYIREQELGERYRVVRPDEPTAWWNARYAAASAIETSSVHIIAGAIIPLWHKLKTEGDSKLHVIRVCTKDGQRIVGVKIPPAGVGKVLRSLGLGNTANDPQQVFTAVFQQGEEIDLASNLRLKRSMLQREPAIELVCFDSDRFKELRELGLINEQIKFKQRFFVPTDEKRGLPILSKLLDRYPVLEPEGASEPPESEGLPVIEGPEAAEVKIVDLEQWVLPPYVDVPPAMQRIGDSVPVAFIAAGVPSQLPELPTQTGPSLIALLEQQAQSVERTKSRRQRPQVDAQGLLFSLQ